MGKLKLLYQHPITGTFLQLSEPLLYEDQGSTRTVRYGTLKKNRVELNMDSTGLYTGGVLYMGDTQRTIEIVKQKEGDLVFSCTVLTADNKKMYFCLCNPESKNVQEIKRYLL